MEVPYEELERAAPDLTAPVVVEPAEDLTPAAEDLTACPELGLSVLVTEDIEDLDPACLATEDDLVAVAVEALLTAEEPLAPLLDLDMDWLLMPADLDMEPIPVLTVEPAAAFLDL